MVLTFNKYDSVNILHGSWAKRKSESKTQKPAPHTITDSNRLRVHENKTKGLWWPVRGARGAVGSNRRNMAVRRRAETATAGGITVHGHNTAGAYREHRATGNMDGRYGSGHRAGPGDPKTAPLQTPANFHAILSGTRWKTDFDG